MATEVKIVVPAEAKRHICELVLRDDDANTPIWDYYCVDPDTFVDRFKEAARDLCADPAHGVQPYEDACIGEVVEALDERPDLLAAKGIYPVHDLPPIQPIEAGYFDGLATFEEGALAR